jgi:hypothetical protein
MTESAAIQGAYVCNPASSALGVTNIAKRMKVDYRESSDLKQS